MKRRRTGLGNVAPLMRTTIEADSDALRRRMLADLCRRLAGDVFPEPAKEASFPEEAATLAPRVRQTLERILSGDSEKQAAQQLGVSRHTVHVYVKTLYRAFGVSSRGELLARFVVKDKASTKS